MKTHKTYILGALLLAATAISNAEDRFVASWGVDSNPGTPDQPWGTVSKAGAAAVAGDTVFIRGGTYYDRLAVRNSGSPGAPIIFRNYPGESVTIDGTDIRPFSEFSSGGRSWFGTVDLYGASYVEIRGLRVQNSAGNGIFGEDTHHVVIANNTVVNSFNSGIGFLIAGVQVDGSGNQIPNQNQSLWRFSTDVTIQDNEVTGNNNGGWSEVVSLEGVNGFLVQGNYIHGNKNGQGGDGGGGENIDAKRGSRNGNIIGNVITDSPRLGIYVESYDAETFNISVLNNKVYGLNGDGIRIASEQGGEVHDINVYNNLVYKNLNGIALPQYPSSVSPDYQPVNRVKIYNNTVTNNGGTNSYGQQGIGIQLDNKNATGIAIANNIVTNNAIASITATFDGVLRQNLNVYSNLQYPYNNYYYEVAGSNSIQADPQFVDASSDNYQLNAGSPAVDSADSSLVPGWDYNWTNRPVGGGPDRGAYER